MLLKNGVEVRHDLRGDVLRDVNEGAVRAVLIEIVLVEIAGDEGVGQLVAADENAYLLAEGVGHKIPLDLNARLLSELYENGIGVVAARKSAHTADDKKLILILVAAGLSTAAAGGEGEYHYKREYDCCNSFHFHFSFFILLRRRS